MATGFIPLSIMSIFSVFDRAVVTAASLPGPARIAPVPRPLLRASVLVTAMALFGCAGGNLGLRRAPEVDAPQARALYEQGEFGRAAQAYLNLARYDRNERASYRLQAAQAWREEGEWNQAREALRDLKRRELDAEEAFMLDLLYAEMALSEGDLQAASDLLVVDARQVPESLRPRLLELRARTFEASGDWVNAAAERVRLDPQLAASDRQDNALAIDELLGRLPDQDRLELLRTLERSDPLYPWLLKRVPASAGGSVSYAAELVTSALPAIDASALDPIQIPPVQFAKLALLLPLQGELAQAGQAIRDGVFAGYFSEPGPRPQVQIYDSGNSPESALAAFDRAVAEGADRVLGPFPREQVSALFRRGTSVPTLALNYAEAPALPPPGSLQFALLPEEEAIAVADYMWAKGLRQVTALVPDDDFGRRTLDGFRVRFEALGGVLVDPQFFNPQVTDNSPAIRAALGLSESVARAQQVRAITGLQLTAQPSRRPDLDGIFLAARPPQARLLLPQLRSFDAAEWPIVATSHLYAGVPSTLDFDLNGVEFVDAPWLYEPIGNLPNRDQVAALSATQGPAVRLFAFGLDAWQLVSRIEWLEEHPREVLAGATGKLASDGRGSIRRQGVWRRFREGRAESLP